jgi:hypothetical protein
VAVEIAAFESVATITPVEGIVAALWTTLKTITIAKVPHERSHWIAAAGEFPFIICMLPMLGGSQFAPYEDIVDELPFVPPFAFLAPFPSKPVQLVITQHALPPANICFFVRVESAPSIQLAVAEFAFGPVAVAVSVFALETGPDPGGISISLMRTNIFAYISSF